LFCEHPHVYTLGRSGDEKNLLVDDEALKSLDATFYKNNRGGDITYHGPGQIVGYPIVSLEPRRDLHVYLRFLEQVLINSVGHLGLAADRNPGKTGIWLGNRKVAAIGVAVRRWVSYHGFALNVSTDLNHFSGIIPCGIASTDGTVTSLEAELRRPVSQEEVRALLAREFWALLPAYRDGSFD
jgi:lipoyl(octanoyl) transferase